MPQPDSTSELQKSLAERILVLDGAMGTMLQRAEVPAGQSPRVERPTQNRFSDATGRPFAGAYPGTYPFVGTPDDIAEEMSRMQAAGFAGTSIAFVDYLAEIPLFIEEVLPRLERLGLRQPAIDAQQ